jgi:outer membrane protein TolC
LASTFNFNININHRIQEAARRQTTASRRARRFNLLLIPKVNHMVKYRRQTRFSFVFLFVASVMGGSMVFLPAALQAHPATNPDGLTPADPPVRIALVVDTGPAADSLAGTVRAEIRSLLEPATPVQFSRFSTPDAAAVPRDTHRTTAVIAVGPGAASRLCRPPDNSSGRSHRDSTGPSHFQTPVFAVSSGSGILMAHTGNSGTRCTVVGPVGWPSETFRAFQRLVHFDRVDVFVDAEVADAVDNASHRVRQIGREAGVTARLVPVRDGTRSESTGIRSEKEGNVRRAVFLDHLDRWDAREVEALTGRLAEGSAAVFAYNPRHVTHHGALAAPDVIERLRARRTALAIEQVVRDNLSRATQTQRRDSLGADHTATQRMERLVVNRSVARRQGVDLPWDIQVRARLVGTRAAAGESSAMSLAASMRESIRSNLALEAEIQQTAAQANRVDIARSRLLPQVTASATGTTVSEEVAAASFGSQPEREVSSTLSFRQVLFNEPAFAELSVERRMQAMREFERQATRLDAAQQAADAYIRVLQTRAGVRIQRENVRVVRANLKAARSRRSAGVADRREVSRLETQLARAEQGLLRALGRERRAEIAYNRVLDRPLDADVRLDRSPGVDPRPVLQDFPYIDLLDTPTEARSFERFWVQTARTRAPQVEAVKRLVQARERQVTSANRAFWMPQLSLEGAVSQRLSEAGEGTSGLRLPLGSDGGGTSIPTPPDEQWSLSLTASFPLFNGTERAAQKRRASDQLAASRTRRRISRTQAEQAARTALVNLETSVEAVRRALQAADAAQQTLDVTQAAYREGTATLVDLIDAQSTALSTRQEASDAAYGVLSDWVALQRAAGSFRVLRTPDEQAEFEQRLRTRLSPDARDDLHR